MKNKLAVRQDISPPPRYNVVYFDDDNTDFDFVVESLIDVFGHSPAAAADRVEHIHENGRAVAATGLVWEIAEKKTLDVLLDAKNRGFPLDVRVEEETASIH